LARSTVARIIPRHPDSLGWQYRLLWFAIVITRGGTGLAAQQELGFTHRFEPATAQNAPVLLLLHGTGGDENSLLPLGKAIAPGAALLSPRGKVLEQGMARFVRRLPEGSFDQQDLDVQTSDLANFVTEAEAAYSIPAGKLVAAGYSNGANMAASLLLRFPESLAGAILMRGMVPFVPATAIDLKRRPVLLLSGVEDPIVGTDEVAELANIFRAANAELTLHWETAGHPLSQGDVLMAFDWLRRFFHSPRTGAAK
jgi:phospholipase/carboxylesterase